MDPWGLKIISRLLSKIMAGRKKQSQITRVRFLEVTENTLLFHYCVIRHNITYHNISRTSHIETFVKIYYFIGRKFCQYKLSQLREFFGSSRKFIPAKSWCSGHSQQFTLTKYFQFLNSRNFLKI